MREIMIGDTVRWNSGAGGSFKEKIGKVIAVIKKNERGHSVLPKYVSKGQIKFQCYNMVSDRFLVEVPRGGQSKRSNYYAPPVTWPSKVEEANA